MDRLDDDDATTGFPAMWWGLTMFFSVEAGSRRAVLMGRKFRRPLMMLAVVVPAVHSAPSSFHQLSEPAFVDTPQAKVTVHGGCTCHLRRMAWSLECGQPGPAMRHLWRRRRRLQLRQARPKWSRCVEKAKSFRSRPERNGQRLW